MPRREIIQIHIGQAGVNLAESCWELFCLEHGISLDGNIVGESRCHIDDSFSSYFTVSAAGTVEPRTIMIDLEPSAINNVKIGHLQKIFDHTKFVTGKEDTANIYTAGYCGHGRELYHLAVDCIRLLAEKCNNLEGFVLFRCFGGGTGSGFSSQLLEHISERYNKQIIMEFGVFPSPNVSPVIIEPYNTVLTTHASMENEDCCFILDNGAGYDILVKNIDEDDALTYKGINRLFAQVIASATSSLRFQGPINVSLEEFQKNIVPYPRIHYPLITYSPVINVNRPAYEELTLAQMTERCFHPDTSLVKCDPRTGKYLNAWFLYRGQVNPTDINSAITWVKAQHSKQFINWCPVGFKIGLNYNAIETVPKGHLGSPARDCTIVSNNSAIKEIWERLITKYDMMLNRKAYLYHYLSEGLEESEFHDARENLLYLIDDYREVEIEVEDPDSYEDGDG
ncbi:tubulin alpha-4 chain-like [Aethina tumida]|uniref:tubulin alpha-4 chain-like n=1 Tax=Aethina tumida TaxID=116153 RepID=UPI00214778BB|nr:tubulin alpha-4 chain-like [Aethina tumida]